jgi:hypothetical protein
MYVELGAGGHVFAAYLTQQYPGQKWLPIDSRTLQVFLASAPTVTTDVMGRQGLRRISRATAASPFSA